VYTNGSWSLHDNNTINKAVVTTDATPGTSLSAIAYNINGTWPRQVFLFDAGGLLRSTNATTTTGDAVASVWGGPIVVSGDVASTSGTADLAACVDNISMQRIRVYNGVQDGYVQEVAYMFNDTGDGWNETNSFDWSDGNSGVACVVYDNADQDDQYLKVYIHDTTGQITQNYVRLISALESEKAANTVADSGLLQRMTAGN